MPAIIYRQFLLNSQVLKIPSDKSSQFLPRRIELFFEPLQVFNNRKLTGLHETFHLGF